MGRVGEGDHVVQMVKDALESGYRHIDTVGDLFSRLLLLQKVFYIGSQLWYASDASS
jgi:hypothetical protein